MICAPCRLGGRYNWHMLRLPENLRHIDAAHAAAWHAECPGGTQCDCQHYIGQAIAKGQPR
jgi:hypothetical protein